MTLDELLKDDQETAAKVKAAIDKQNEGQTDKLKLVKFADLSEGAYVSKGKYDEAAATGGNDSKALAEANELIEKLKAGATGKDTEEIAKYTATIETMKAEYENNLSKLQAESLENKLKLALTETKAKDLDYVAFKIKEKGELKLDDKGNIIGLQDTLKEIKEKYPTQFQDEGTKTHERKLDEHNTDEHGAVTETLAGALQNKYTEKKE